MAVLLDTDHLSILQGQVQPACDRLLARLDELPPDDISTSIVSFQEQFQGWQAYLNSARKPEQIVLAYTKLDQVVRSFLKMNVVAFGPDAQARFDLLRKQCRRLRTLDLRIASVALVEQATLLSCNLRDFRQVPGLVVEDWTVAASDGKDG